MLRKGRRRNQSPRSGILAYSQTAPLQLTLCSHADWKLSVCTGFSKDMSVINPDQTQGIVK